MFFAHLIFRMLTAFSCPYVTAVGATKIPAGGSVSGGEVVANDPAGHPYYSAYASGGGFSNLFPIPDYQADAVARLVFLSLTRY